MQHNTHFRAIRKPESVIKIRSRKKPAWAVVEIIRLKALMPQLGCRSLTDIFNRRFAQQRISVSKSWVAYTLKQHRRAVMLERRKIKQKPPYAVKPYRYWGIDLTGITDKQGEIHTILGICEHHSRKTLVLTNIRNKASVTLLRAICDAIECFGKPQIIRTDNEAVFTSRLFRWGLKLLGINHQTTDLGCPWQNGRIERLFGTLKKYLRQITIDNGTALALRLAEFQWWYNTVRPHQNLHGRTPNEVWYNQPAPATRRWRYVALWDGLLQGYYARE
jgi:putative transposase